MGRKGVTYEDVVEAALALLRNGESATTARVHRHLGTGSYTTISKYLREWRSRLKDSATGALPAGLPDELVEPLESLWSVARAYADQEYRDRIEAAEKARAKAQVALDESEDLLKTAEKSRTYWREQAEATQVQYQEVIADLAKAHDRVHAETNRAEAAERDLAQTRDTAAARLRALRSESRHRRDQDKQTIDNLRADLEREADRHDATQQYWAKQVDQTRAEQKTTMDNLKTQIDRLNADLKIERARTQAAQARQTELERKLMEGS